MVERGYTSARSAGWSNGYNAGEARPADICGMTPMHFIELVVLNPGGKSLDNAAAFSCGSRQTTVRL